MQPALVIFDLDGTLIDSAPDMHRAVNRMLDDLGCAPLSLADIRSMVGDGASALIARALAARQCVTADPAKALALFLEHYEAEPTAFTRTYPDVHGTLDRLRAHGLTLALCTNKPARLTQMILERLEIDRYFVRVIAGDSLPFRKPDPRALLAVLTGLDTHMAATLMVGDSEVDAATAQAAGVPFILMTYGYHRGPIDGISSIATLDRFHELATLLHA
ncbi:MAG: cbbZ [Gammaproteobacteria bacterium]|nr:cbbZ [Gammaproteobacteria bacterium]